MLADPLGATKHSPSYPIFQLRTPCHWPDPQLHMPPSPLPDPAVPPLLPRSHSPCPHAPPVLIDCRRLYGRDGWCNGRNVLPWVVDITDQAFSDGVGGNEPPPSDATVSLSYSALWCRTPDECASPDPGPSSSWQQAPPVMMVSVYVLLGALIAPPRPWWRQPWGIGALGAALAAALLLVGVSVWAMRRRRLQHSTSSSAAASLLDN